ncbi:1609_t:CDS:2, partial [Gigaspora rosea]
ADNVKTRLNFPESISYLQDLVPKMARVFDNTNALRGAKKSGLKTIRAKLGLLNSALHVTYGLEFKAVDKYRRHCHLIGLFDNIDTSNKLSPDELIVENLLGNKQTKDTPGSNINTVIA